jgi:hypothetical protein
MNPFSVPLRPIGFLELKVSRFLDTRLIKRLGLSALRNGKLYHPLPPTLKPYPVNVKNMLKS